MEDSSSSEMSGIPSGSSVASSEQPYPVYMAFSWVPMVLDDQVVGRLGGPRLWESCRQPQFRATHDDDQEGDGRGPAPRDWHRNISARGWPFDDLSHTGSHGAQQHTRSPHGGGRCHGEIGVSAQDHRGQQMSRSPVRHRAHQPHRRDDGG
jgi:hypothetical protein